MSCQDLCTRERVLDAGRALRARHSPSTRSTSACGASDRIGRRAAPATSRMLLGNEHPGRGDRSVARTRTAHRRRRSCGARAAGWRPPDRSPGTPGHGRPHACSRGDLVGSELQDDQLPLVRDSLRAPARRYAGCHGRRSSDGSASRSLECRRVCRLVSASPRRVPLGPTPVLLSYILGPKTLGRRDPWVQARCHGRAGALRPTAHRAPCRIAATASGTLQCSPRRCTSAPSRAGDPGPARARRKPARLRQFARCALADSDAPLISATPSSRRSAYALSALPIRAAYVSTSAQRSSSIASRTPGSVFAP